MFDIFKNRLELTGTLTTVTALRISAGRSSEPIGSDLPVIKDALGKPIIPGSSFKGAMRSRLESFLRGIVGNNRKLVANPAIEEEWSLTSQEIKQLKNDFPDDLALTEEIIKQTDLVSSVFGSPWIASKFQVRDLTVVEDTWFGQYQERDGVSIDRDTETAADGKLYDFQVVPAGTQFEFMTQIPKPQPRKVTPPQRPIRDNSTENNSNKPYQFVSFPRERPLLQKPAGHDKFDKNRLHGTLFLKLQVQTSLHVSTGIVAPGSDVDSRVALIKTMTQGVQKHLLIQGSSLKGCIRSVYEAITNSTLAVVTSKYRDKIPQERLPCRNKTELCPASQVFGALDWQGLIEFHDAKCESIGFNTGFMPSLYRPHPEASNIYLDTRGKVAGRKFYYHTIRAIEKGQNQGIAVQQAASAYTFTTQLQFKNLKPEELGTLLVVLGQDSKYPIALKVGGGKPIGMGTMTVEVTQARVLQNIQDLRSRYCQYTSTEDNLLTGSALQKFIQNQIQTAHSRLIQSEQLQQLAQVLHYPTDRQPPEGMY